MNDMFNFILRKDEYPENGLRAYTQKRFDNITVVLVVV